MSESSSSKTSGRSMSNIGGPCTINGTVFCVVKRCPLCTLKNTDDNVLRGGAWGPQYSEFQVWERESCENPVGRFDKVCVRVYEDGGFSAEHDSVDAFIEARKKDSDLQAEWDSARKIEIDLMSEETANNKRTKSKK